MTSGHMPAHPGFTKILAIPAQTLAPLLLSKGSKVAIEGALCWSQWKKDGQKWSKIEDIIEEIEFLSYRETDTGYFEDDGDDCDYDIGGYGESYRTEPSKARPCGADV